MDPPEDRWLGPLTAEGDAREAAWRRLYDAYFEDMRRLLAQGGADLRDLDDLTQKVFVVAYERMGDLTHLSQPGGWLRGIALRVLSSHRRWRRVRRVKHWLVDLRARERDAPPTPEEDVLQAAESERVRSTLDRLKASHREVLLLCDLQGASPAEAAEVLGVPTNTVRSRRRAAREAFARHWRRDDGGTR